MTEQAPRVDWPELNDRAREAGLLVKKLYVITSEPTAGVGPVMEQLEGHLAYQHQLEQDGTMFAAGPLASANEQWMLNEGSISVRVFYSGGGKPQIL